jgi:ubiquinone/menaquinone biosynthesis C-methylase UbiE
MDNYKQSMKHDLLETELYYSKSSIKTEQQKMLEQLLAKEKTFSKSNRIADIACGGGTLSYHLSKISNHSTFTLVDYMEESLLISKNLNKENIDRFSILRGDIYKLNFNKDTFDYSFCWQTLSWLDEPESALNELIRITKKGGKIYLSSLFNLEHDVDIYSKVFDYTRSSGLNGNYTSYNTYSEYTISKWLNGKVKNFTIHKFDTNKQFEYSGRGLGTFTKNCENKMIQVSAGMLMNWGILEIEV